nr:unnamed protein product [Callosobruchus chinensis]CAH7734136.1 unnamed protein product [Callosobruchus chinensis]
MICRPVIRSMYFVDVSGKKIIIPSFKNWVSSLDLLIYLIKHLLEKITSVNVNPTCLAFVNANKSLLLNNLVSRPSLGSNKFEGICDNRV